MFCFVFLKDKRSGNKWTLIISFDSSDHSQGLQWCVLNGLPDIIQSGAPRIHHVAHDPEVKTWLWWNNGMTKHVPFALRQLAWQKLVRHKDGLLKSCSTRNHVLLFAGYQSSAMCGSVDWFYFQLVIGLGGNDATTLETRTPIMHCSRPGLHCVFIHQNSAASVASQMFLL